MLWILSTADTVTDAWPPNIQFIVRLQMKDQERNVYIAYIFCANCCPELHLQLFPITCPNMEPSLYVFAHTELMAPVRMQPKDRE